MSRCFVLSALLTTLSLPQLSWAGPIFISLDGDHSELVARIVGEFDPQGSDTFLSVTPAESPVPGNVGDFEFTFANLGELGGDQVPHGAGGGQTITVPEIPLGDGTFLFLDPPLQFQASYSEFVGDPSITEVKNKVKMIAGGELNLSESDFTIQFLDDNLFVVEVNFVGTITSDFTIVPEPATLTLMFVGAGCLISRRRR